MRLWIVTWIAEGNIPGVDVFNDQEQALACLRYMLETGKTATVKTVTITQKPEEPQEEPQEAEEGGKEE